MADSIEEMLYVLPVLLEHIIVGPLMVTATAGTALTARVRAALDPHALLAVTEIVPEKLEDGNLRVYYLCLVRLQLRMIKVLSMHKLFHLH